jgi:branched-chain amino acid aminotransferase
MAEFRSVTSIDGRISETSEAAVPVLDRGFLYGDSVYEVFRTYSGVPLLYDEHWRRLENSAALIEMRLQLSRDEVGEAIRAAVRASRAPEVPCDVYVRYIVTRGEGEITLLPAADLEQRLVVIVAPVPAWKKEYYDRGISLAIVGTRRNDANALDPNIKGGNYLNNVLGILESKQRGAEDCLMLDRAGRITESSTSNVFFVQDGVLVTPAESSANLRGLTKQTLLELCEREGLACSEEELSAADAAAADECFITSATREVMPVSSLLFEDGSRRDYPSGGGEMTRRIAASYKAFIESYVRSHGRDSMY